MFMKRAILLFILVFVMLFSFGCNKKSGTSVTDKASIVNGIATVTPSEVTKEATVVKSEIEETTENTGVEETEDTIASNEVRLPVPDTSFVSQEMLINALLAEGNLARLAAAMRKAQNGEEITVGVIGGSITQGFSATNMNNSYAQRFYQWWVTAFPKAKINFVNAGIGATTSYLGVHRVEEDLLSHHPDVVIVEFSVNDSDSTFYKETYEDLLRKILKAKQMPAVLLLFMTMEDGTSAQPIHMHLGFWYDLPRISYRQAVLKEIEKGTFTWKDISPDNIHPNDKGHAIVGEILWVYLNSVYKKLPTITEEPKPLEKKSFAKEAYIDAGILDSESIDPITMGSFTKANIYNRFKNNWTTSSGNEAIVFETEAQNIGIMFYKTTDGKSGQFDIYIDGVFNRTLDADFSGGWGNYAETVEVYRSKEKQLHRIEILKSDQSTGDVFSILGLLIS